jgi:hypothetical protein
MLEALWAVTFASASHRDERAGIVVLETGRVLGGDNQFVYTGDYAVRPGGSLIEARVRVRKHFNWPEGISIFGHRDNFELAMTGKSAKSDMTMRGHIVGEPNATIVISFRRVAELP